MKKIYFLIPLVLVILACGAQTTLPTIPTAQAETPNAVTNTIIKAPPLAQPTAEKVMSVCLTAESVRLRMGAGTSYGEVAILSSLDSVTVTGVPVVSEDMGVWMPVRFGAVDGWINARYLC